MEYRSNVRELIEIASFQQGKYFYLDIRINTDISLGMVHTGVKPFSRINASFVNKGFWHFLEVYKIL